jgi:hypothetical protein
VPNAANRTASTLIIDLKQEDRIIWDNMHKNTRYEIRRELSGDAEVCWPADKLKALEAFAVDYSKLSKRKNLGSINFSVIRPLVESGTIVISRIAASSFSSIGWHLYVIGCGRARLLYSVAEGSQHPDAAVRARVARLNRLHHWRDILHFKALGFETYDFGGWYDGRADTVKLRINLFKEGFGGRKEIRYNAVVGSTVKGKVALWVYNKISACLSAFGAFRWKRSTLSTN